MTDIIATCNHAVVMERTLKSYAEETGKTQTQMAQEFGISVPFCNQIINGERRPSPEVAARIEAITGVPLRELLGLGALERPKVEA